MTVVYMLIHGNAVTFFYEYLFLSPNGSLFAVWNDFNTSKQLFETFFSSYITQRKSDLEKKSPGLFDKSPGLSDFKAYTVSITLLSSHYPPSFSTYGSLVIMLSTVIRIKKKSMKGHPPFNPLRSSPGRARALKAFSGYT